MKDLLTEQAGEVRFEWGETGAGYLAREAQVIILVDIFSFSTALDAALARQATVYPFIHNDRAAQEFARAHGALMGVERNKTSKENPYSLWPPSLTTLPLKARLVLPVLHGATLTSSAARHGHHVLAGCLRNRAAIANFAVSLGSPIAVIAAGERWPNEAFRPAYEDLLGAGAIIQSLISLGANPSAEAAAAASAFSDAAPTLLDRLRHTLTSRLLLASHFPDDAAFAAQVDVSTSLPYFKSGIYRHGLSV